MVVRYGLEDCLMLQDDCGQFVDIEDYEKLESERDALKAERDQLKDWKEQMLLVESKWEEQAIAKLLKIKLGDPIRENIKLKIENLFSTLLTLLETAKTVCDSGEFYGSTFECDESYILNLIQSIKLTEDILKG